MELPLNGKYSEWEEKEKKSRERIKFLLPLCKSKIIPYLCKR